MPRFCRSDRRAGHGPFPAGCSGSPGRRAPPGEVAEEREISPTFFFAPECHSSISLDMKSLSVTAGVINRSAFSPFWLARPLTSPLEISVKALLFFVVFYLQPPRSVLFLVCCKCDVEESVPQVKLFDGAPLSPVIHPLELGGDQGVAEPDRQIRSRYWLRHLYANVANSFHIVGSSDWSKLLSVPSLTSSSYFFMISSPRTKGRNSLYVMAWKVAASSLLASWYTT